MILSGTTQLSLVHTHTLILGMFMFLILLPLEKLFKLSSYYLFNSFSMYITWCYRYYRYDGDKGNLPSHW
ncbi:DUF2871 family protein [Staphylococcus aureus]